MKIKIFIIISILMLNSSAWARIVYRGQKNTFIQFADSEPGEKYNNISADLVIVRCTYSGSLVEALGLEKVYYAYFLKDRVHGGKRAFKIVSGLDAHIIFRQMKKEYGLQA